MQKFVDQYLLVYDSKSNTFTVMRYNQDLDDTKLAFLFPINLAVDNFIGEEWRDEKKSATIDGEKVILNLVANFNTGNL